VLRWRNKRPPHLPSRPHNGARAARQRRFGVMAGDKTPAAPPRRAPQRRPREPPAAARCGGGCQIRPPESPTAAPNGSPSSRQTARSGAAVAKTPAAPRHRAPTRCPRDPAAAARCGGGAKSARPTPPAGPLHAAPAAGWRRRAAAAAPTRAGWRWSGLCLTKDAGGHPAWICPGDLQSIRHPGDLRPWQETIATN